VTGPRVFLTADGTSLAVERNGIVGADGRLGRERGSWVLWITARPGHPAGAEETEALLQELVALAGRSGGGPARWTARDPTSDDDESAKRAGLGDVRDLLQLRRPLPVAPDERGHLPAITTRPYRPGLDDARWLEVNNRAFAHHPDQSGKTPEDLASLTAQRWFDAAGLLLLDASPSGDRSGRLDGFCWTKVHAEHDPPLGEIFVIGVDPDATGHGLGHALTIAGLDHLHHLGLATGMLYVDVDNTGAVAMYERLGFSRHHLERLYQGHT